MRSLREAARLLEGEVVTGGQVVFRAPGHSRADRSASIKLGPKFGPEHPDDFTVNSFAGDPFGPLRDHVKERLLGSARWPRSHAPRSERIITQVSDQDDAERTRNALALWEAAQSDLRGTPIEVYFTRPKRDGGRGLIVPYDIAGGVLRYHPACPWKDDQTGEFLQVPAMLAARRCIHTDQLKAVHCTRLTEDGYKVDRRNRGPARGTAIKIDADETVSHGLGIAEGVETALSARQVGWRPIWAVGSAGAIETFSVLSGVECITLHAENDKTGTNERAIHECASRWHAANREVIVVHPKAGKDLNDALGGITNA